MGWTNSGTTRIATAACAAAALAAGLILAGCGTAGAPPRPEPKVVLDAKGEPQGLEHHRRWSGKLGQGGQPQGEAAFSNLAALGYRTLVSVDGAKPDAELASKYGLRYVHVPIEYNGVTRDQALRIVKAVQTADGPVFVHCHHGLHRGPAGAMVARIAVDGISNAEALEELKASGCSPKYEGLYRDILAFVPPTAGELATVPSDLPAYVAPGDMAEHMAAVDRVFDRLGACQKAGWGPPPEMPDVNPPHEARIFWEHFAEIRRLDESKSHGPKFLEMLAQTEADGRRVEEAVRAGRKADADAALANAKKVCGACHTEFRDR